jgi:hypothetical protein
MRHSFADAGIALLFAVIDLGLICIIASSHLVGHLVIHTVKRFVLACAVMALMALAYAGWKWFRENRVPKWALNLGIALTWLAMLPELIELMPGYVAKGAMK